MGEEGDKELIKKAYLVEEEYNKQKEINVDEENEHTTKKL